MTYTVKLIAELKQTLGLLVKDPIAGFWGPLRGREGRGTGMEGQNGGERKVEGWREEEGKEGEGGKGEGKKGKGEKGGGNEGRAGKEKQAGAGVVVLGGGLTPLLRGQSSRSRTVIDDLLPA